MEYCSLGDLSYFIRKRSQLVTTHPLISQILQKYPSPPGSNGLNTAISVHFLKQLASALEFLRSKNLVHRDIKPQNLLLCYPAKSKQDFIDGKYAGKYDLPILKIADFGFARFLPNQSLAETLCGSPLYMAPEILNYEKYNAKADLWSVGAVLYEMCVGKPPFKANNHVELLKRIQQCHDDIKFPESACVDEDLKRLISALLKYRAIERMSFNEFFKDRLVLMELDSGDEELDQSSIDENLFISEYLGHRGDAKKQVLEQQKQLDVEKRKEQKHDEQKQREAKKRQEDRQREKEKELEKEKERERKKEKELERVRELEKEREHQRFEKEKELERERLRLQELDRQEEEQKELLRKELKSDKNSVVDTLKGSSSTENDYVVVEKTAVEVNEIADALKDFGVTKHREEPVDRKRRTSSSGKRPSFSDRRFSISLTPSNALSRALNAATDRLFGSKEMQQMQDSLPLPIQTSPLAPINFGTPGAEMNTNDQLAALVDNLDSLATKAQAVESFVKVKFKQIVPLSSSSAIDDSDDEDADVGLPPVALKEVCEEALALYIKILSLLAKAMNLTSDWWGTNSGNGSYDTSLANRLNLQVQHIRDMFNTCLDNADFVRGQLSTANAKLGISNDENELNTKVIADKMIFDSALEMSRTAAVNELVNEDLVGCEIAYCTSIWMLEAILEPLEDGWLDPEDRAMVQKFVGSIVNRLMVLRKKMEQPVN